MYPHEPWRIGFRRRLPVYLFLLGASLASSGLAVSIFLGGWRGLLFWGYLGIAVLKFIIDFVGTLRFFWRSRLSPTDADVPWVSAQLAIFARGSRLDAAAGHVSTALSILGKCLAWPALLIERLWLGAKLDALHARHSTLARQAMERLYSTDFFRTGFVLLVVVLGCVLSWALETCTSYRVGLLLCVIAQVGTILLSYALVPNVALSALKRRPVAVPARVVGIVCLTYLTLTLSFAGLTACESSRPVTPADIVESGKLLFVSSVKPILPVMRRGWSLELLQRIVGYLFYVTLFGLARGRKTYRRDAGDNLWVAGDYLAVGEFKKGMEWADRVKGADRGQIWLLAKAVGHLGIGEEVRAVDLMRGLAGLLGADGQDHIDPYELLLANVKPYAISPTIIVRVLRRWEANGARDVALASTLEELLMTEEAAYAALASEWLRDPDFERRRPFTVARVMMNRGDQAQARAALRRVTPAGPLERVYQSVFLLRCTVDELSNAADSYRIEDALTRWMTTDWPNVERDARSVPDNEAIQVASVLLWLVRVSHFNAPHLVRLFEGLCAELAKRGTSLMPGEPAGITEQQFKLMLRQARQ